MAYSIKSNGDGTYEISNNGSVIAARLRAKRVSFSEITSHTEQGPVHHLTGPCIVNVDVPGVGNMDLPLS